MYSRAGSMPPVRSIAMWALTFHGSSSVGNGRRMRRTAVGSRSRSSPKPRRRRANCGSRFSAFSAHHARIRDSNSSVTGSPSHAYRRAHLADRVGLHRAEVDVEEPIVGAAVAELQRPFHADRPLPDVELAEVAPVDVVGETARRCRRRRRRPTGSRRSGRDASSRSARRGRPGRGNPATARATGDFNRHGRRRLAPLQQLEHATFVGVGRREVGLVRPAIRSTTGSGRRPGRSAT